MDWIYLGLGTAFGTSLIGSSFLTNIFLTNRTKSSSSSLYKRLK